ncbi:hypothetical protein RZS28_09835 [Methylocapsa polymorpha]|uniref:Uncharacterized protein n=1 Tax=Methylocapsa polymorpha TaxID=3080828 RepID=A0ABZ0HNG8_9HYPH|nr:hypothetical protein RZS28_09835 [Methylocapsa sp. RX1]
MHILRLALLGLAALVALILGWTFWIEANRLEPAPSPKIAETHVSPEAIAAARGAIEAELAAVPEYAGFFDSLKTRFPADYEAFLAKASRRSAATGEIQSADFLIIDAVRALRVSHGVLAAKAEQPALDHVFEMQLAMLRALAGRNQGLCVDFLYGGANGDFLEFSAANRSLVAAMASAGLDAIDNGQINRVERDEPTAEDFQELEKALRAKGLGTLEIEALLDGKTPDPPLDDARMCRAGAIYLETLAALPEPLRMRIYGFAVELMARS